jgi:hypothetical protein
VTEIKEEIVDTDTETDTISLRIDLNENNSRIFRKLKNRLGVENKTEVIRFSLNFTNSIFGNCENYIDSAYLIYILKMADIPENMKNRLIKTLQEGS